MASANKCEWDQLASAVRVRFCSSKADASALEQCCVGWLSYTELARREQLGSDQLRHEYLVTRVLCRTSLSAFTGVDPSDWVFVEDANGKPKIATPGEFRSLRFNLTHTEGLVACAVTRAGEVGVDAEHAGRAVNIDEVINVFFSESERALLATVPTREQRVAAFFEIWVLKEAYLKGSGMGLSRSPESISFARTEPGRSLTIDDGWRVTLLYPTPAHVAATAIKPDDGNAQIAIEWRAVDRLPL